MSLVHGEVGGKACRGCACILPLDQFSVKTGGRFGVEARCRQCERARVRADKSTPEAKARIAQKNRRWREANAEKVRQRHVEYSTRCREAYLESKRRYRARHAEKIREYNSERRPKPNVGPRPQWSAVSFCGDCDSLIRGRRARCEDCSREAANAKREAANANQRAAYAAGVGAWSAEVSAKQSAWFKKNSEELSSVYVRRLLAKSMGIRRTRVPAALVEVKRAHLRLWRLINERKQGNE